MSASEHRSGERGQAAVESALVTPLFVFLLLGILQLILIEQARIVADYGAYRAVRAGTLGRGLCSEITDAALASFLPLVEHVAASRAETVASGWSRLTATYNRHPGTDLPVVVINRVRLSGGPRISVSGFDQPLRPRDTPYRLALEGHFFYEMRIPFVNWVISNIWLAQHIGTVLTGVDPLMPTRNEPPGQINPNIDAQTLDIVRLARQENRFLVPIRVTAALPMMSPPMPELASAGEVTCAP